MNLFYRYAATLFAPEDDPSAGGGGGGGSSASEPPPGGGEGGDDDRPLTRADVQAMFAEHQKAQDDWRKKINRELRDRRHGNRHPDDDEPAGGTKGGSGGEGEDKGYVTREELQAQRDYDRGLGRLEALDIGTEALEQIESQARDLPPAARGKFVAALAEQLAANGSKQPDDTGSRPGGRRPRTKVGRGGEAPPHAPPSDVPQTWDEYVALKKKDPDKARKILKDGLVDLVELREAANAKRAG